jgi:hypothetical protein
MVPVRWVMLEPPSWSEMETPETSESRLHSVSSFCTRDTSTILADGDLHSCCPWKQPGGGGDGRREKGGGVSME